MLQNVSGKWPTTPLTEKKNAKKWEKRETGQKKEASYVQATSKVANCVRA